MHREAHLPLIPPIGRKVPTADALLLEQMRRGDAEAGRHFVREHYPGIYRYLFRLTGNREAAEDLTQETFLQAWRRIETFDDRGHLGAWLHRIAYREFLQALRGRKSQSSLEEVGEISGGRAPASAENLALREAVRALPEEEGRVVELHYLHGYSCERTG